ncbi:hypothetical protein Sp245p_27125 (plasmid) [Azospirillum baldaniorum]|nr:hypothetical protein Sp245p_27125 [Azospirillum baldaniorum]
MQRFISMHAAASGIFNLQHHLISRRILHTSRAQAMANWRAVRGAHPLPSVGVVSRCGVPAQRHL